MTQVVNAKYKPVFTENWYRYLILMGGRSAGRSYVASQRSKARLMAPEYYRAAIMRYIQGDIRNSNFQEIVDRLEESRDDHFVGINENNLTFTYGENSIRGIGFRKSSSSQKSKLKSLASFNEVDIEEADEIEEDDFNQLDDSLRTMKGDITLGLFLNPPHRDHWIVKRWFNLVESDIPGFYIPVLKEKYRHNTLFIHTTYLDNLENISPSTVDNFENYKEINPDYYYNSIMGLISEGAKGRIYEGWQPITRDFYDELEFEEFYGLDFGFTNDPTSLTGLKLHNRNLWADEIIYSTGLTNQALSREMEAKGLDKRTAVIYADNAEPKSIEELRVEGWNVLPAKKGQGSLNAGIDIMQSLVVCYTEDSENIAREQREYKWKLDRDKLPTNTPEDKHNHAMDGMRYGVYTRNAESFIGFA